MRQEPYSDPGTTDQDSGGSLLLTPRQGLATPLSLTPLLSTAVPSPEGRGEYLCPLANPLPGGGEKFTIPEGMGK